MIFSTSHIEMPRFCAVVGCGRRGNRDKNSFFRIPCIPIRGTPEMIALKTERRMKWILALRRKDLTETKLRYGSICDRHFISGRPAATRDIYNPDWVPNQNMGYDISSKNRNQTTTKAIICYVTPSNPQHGEKETVGSEVIHKDENSLFKSEHFFDQLTNKSEMQETRKDAIICYVKASNWKETQDRRTDLVATHTEKNSSVYKNLICS